MNNRKNRMISRTISAAAAAMLLCCSCGSTEEEPAFTTVKVAAQPVSTSSEEPDKEKPDSSEKQTATVTEPDKPADEPADKPDTPAAPANDQLTAPDRKTLTGFADFSAGLLKNACKKDLAEGKNVLVSPESVMLALGMTAQGADGKTLEQMSTVLSGSPDLDTAVAGMRYLASHIPETEGVKVNIANSIWTRKCDTLRLNQSFANEALRNFNAECFCVPFDDQALSDINGWVNNNTNGMIPSILDEINPDSFIYLINAIAFEAEWYDEYEDSDIIENQDFTNSKGETEKCTMLFSTESRYMTDGSAQAFYKLYKGGKYAFMGILPGEGVSAEEYIAGLDGESWYKLTDSCESEDVYVRMPEFTYDYDKELKDALTDMGMDIPFTPGADFRKMAEYDYDYMYINRVLHKTHIEVDREGTKAAAATAVEMKCENAVAVEPDPKIITLDRPFVYAIVDYETGFPVFLGALNTMQS